MQIYTELLHCQCPHVKVVVNAFHRNSMRGRQIESRLNVRSRVAYLIIRLNTAPARISSIGSMRVKSKMRSTITPKNA